MSKENPAFVVVHGYGVYSIIGPDGLRCWTELKPETAEKVRCVLDQAFEAGREHQRVPERVPGPPNPPKRFHPREMALILCALLCSPAHGQIQIMEPRKLRVLQSYIPTIADHPNIQAKLSQAMVYDSKVMPACYQFQPLVNGVGADYTVLFSPSVSLDGSAPTSRTNEPGGLESVDPTKVSKFALLWLPPNPAGGVWPIVVWRGKLQPMPDAATLVYRGVRATSMPAPVGWRWIFPEGTLVVDVLLKTFSDGSWGCYAMRCALREIDDWDVEVYVPFDSLDALEKQFGKISGRIAHRTIQDPNHARMALNRTFPVYELPPLPNSGRAIRTTVFKPMMGSHFLRSGTDIVFATTAFDHDNIVPANYLGAGIGTDRDSCKFCHQDTLSHISKFSAQRKYGYEYGSDGRRSFHPFEPSCIGPPEKQPVLRKAFVDAGLVAIYDQAIHPSSVYQVAKGYENP